MPTRRHYRRPNPDRRRALELLAGSRYGYTKAILRAHGFSIDMMVELVKAGLATTKRERMVADGRQTGVVRVRIGRRKGVLESFVECLFLAPTLIAIAIVLMRFAVGIGNHFGFSDIANRDMTQISVR